MRLGYGTTIIEECEGKADRCVWVERLQTMRIHMQGSVLYTVSMQLD